MKSRENIVADAKEWFASQEPPAFEPGVTYIPPSGMVLDSDDCATRVTGKPTRLPARSQEAKTARWSNR